MPKFTVNIATYNQLPTLKLILEALVAQPYKDFELIVCDDGSYDGTKEYFYGRPDVVSSSTTTKDGEEFLEVVLEDGTRYFWQEDKGFRLAKSKNNGIRAATGDYFISLEADVIPHRHLLLEYERNASSNMVIYGVRHDIREIPETIDPHILDDAVVSLDFRMGQLRNFANVVKPWRLCSGCNFLMPTAKLKAIGGWDEDFKHYGLDDYEVCARLYKEGCDFMALPSAYGYHIKHDIRATSDENIQRLEEAERKLGL